MSPEEVFQLIIDHISYAHPDIRMIPDLEKFNAEVQTYYDRLAELREQLRDAIPPDAPSWIHSSASGAHMLAVQTANNWRSQSTRKES